MERLYGGRKVLSWPPESGKASLPSAPHLVEVFPMRKVNVSVRIEQEDLERLEDLSRETGKSISSMICRAVKEFLEKKVEVEK